MVENYGNVGNFGETQEYQFVRKESRERGAKALKVPGAFEAVREVFGNAVEKVREVASNVSERHERKNKLVLGVGEVEKSKGMTYEGGRPTACEDGHFVDIESGVFAVFDGVGGEKGGRAASQLAVEGMRHFSKRGELEDSDDIKTALERISGAIERAPEAGATTATVAKISRERGRKYLDYVQVGDSRIYVVRGRDAYQVTQDEGIGHRIDNWLGGGAGKITQTGRFPLMSGDKIVLCTDGVTGDYGDERMSNYEIADIVNRGAEVGSPQVSARILVEEARKHDDRTAIVVEV